MVQRTRPARHASTEKKSPSAEAMQAAFEHRELGHSRIVKMTDEAYTRDGIIKDSYPPTYNKMLKAYNDAKAEFNEALKILKKALKDYPADSEVKKELSKLGDHYLALAKSYDRVADLYKNFPGSGNYPELQATSSSSEAAARNQFKECSKIFRQIKRLTE